MAPTHPFFRHTVDFEDVFQGFLLGYDVSELAENTVFSKKMRLLKVFLPRLKSE